MCDSPIWTSCDICTQLEFNSQSDFFQHLRDRHCKREGGSFICTYSKSGLCPFLPLEGVCASDYEEHLLRKHADKQNNYFHMTSKQKLAITNAATSSSQNSDGDGLPSASVKSKNKLLPKANNSLPVKERFNWVNSVVPQNLSAVLNDPRNRRPVDFFTKTWGDSFVELTTIPPSPHLLTVSRHQFELYLKQTTKKYKQHVKRNYLGVDGKGGKELRAVPSNIDTKLPSLDLVPQIFLQSDFSLGNPETFNLVLPHFNQSFSENVSAEKRPSNNSAKLLQEKLSLYLDAVEANLAKQISQRSAAFYRAMDLNDNLTAHLENRIYTVQQLRQKFSKVDDVLVKNHLQVLKLSQTRERSKELFNKLKLMATVHKAQPTIQLLLSSSDYVGALDLICTTQEILRRELAGIKSFRHLGTQLNEIERAIDQVMKDEFTSYIRMCMKQCLKDNVQELDEDSELKLSSIVIGILRRHDSSFINLCKDEMIATITWAVKQVIVEVASEVDDVGHKKNTGSDQDNLSMLNLSQWIDLLQKVFSKVRSIMYIISSLHKIMSRMIKIAAGKNITDGDSQSISNDGDLLILSEEEASNLESLLQNLLCAVCSHANDRCAELIRMGSPSERIPANEFKALSQMIENFVSDCTALSGKRSPGLQLALQTQATKYVSQFHEDRRLKLNYILGAEQWKQSKVPSEFQQIVDHIQQTDHLTLPWRSAAERDRNKSPQNYLLIADEKYVVPGIALLVLEIVVEYCQAVEDTPFLTPELLTRLLDFLRTFNSKTSHLILGAGAMQLVGMKTITTKHLALTSRCLQLVAHYLPKVKDHFQSNLSAKKVYMANHFDQILKDFRNHVNEINKKLIGIISEMFEVQLLKWEVKAPVPSSCFRVIIKQLTIFYETVCDIFPPQQLSYLFELVDTSFQEKLKSHVSRLGINNDGGPQQGLAIQEYSFYIQSLKKLNVLESLDHNVEELWR